MISAIELISSILCLMRIMSALQTWAGTKLDTCPVPNQGLETEYQGIKLDHFFSDEGDGLEDLGRCDVPIIESHGNSKELNSNGYQEALKILQKESGPRFSVMKEDMGSIKDCGKRKGYSNLLETHMGKFYYV